MLARSMRYDLAKATSAGTAERADVFGPGTLRTFGVGGLFGYYGRFRNPRLGNFVAYVTNTHSLVVLRFPDNAVVVSPDDRAAFLNQVQTILKEAKDQERR